MRVPSNNKTRRGATMTEYLVVLALVAVAAIAVVGLFGKQIKSVFTRSNAAMVGETKGADTGTANKSEDETKAHNMGNFDNPASKGDAK